MKTNSRQPLRYLLLVLAGMGTAILWGIFAGGKTAGQPLFAIPTFLMTVTLAILAVRALPIGKHWTRIADAPFLMLFAFFCSNTFYPIFRSAELAGGRSLCVSRAKQISISLGIYCSEFDDRFPISSNWLEASRPYRSPLDQVKCPLATSPYSYAMNSALSKQRLDAVEDIAKTVLLFECIASETNPHGGSSLFFPRHGGAGTIAYADGTVKLTNEFVFKKARWNP